MTDLGGVRLSELVSLGAALRGCGSGADSAETVAARIVSLLYDELRSGQERSCVLVRFYATQQLRDLPQELQTFARTVVDDVPLAGYVPCLTLLATAGERPEWNDRRSSARHQAVPLPSERVLERFPMISQLIRQMGVRVGALIEPDPQLLVELDEQSYNVFFVADAVGSPHIPDQGFVTDFEVASALGFGGMLPTGDLFSVVLFSRTPIPAATAELFKVLALSVKLAVLPFADGPFLTSPAGARPAGPGPATTRSQLLAVEQLLDVQEHTVLAQAARLEELHAQEQRRSQQLRALAEVSVVTGSAMSVPEILSHVTERARDVVGAHQAVASLTTGDDRAQAITSVSTSEQYEQWRDYDAPPEGSGIYAAVCETNTPIRLTQRQLEAHPRWRGFGVAAAQHPPMDGWLAVPLVGRNGQNLGLIQLAGAYSGAFTAEDEAVLVQLARLASVSIENARSHAHEHDLATELQKSLLPQVRDVSGLAVASRYLPAARELGLGGDWYDVIPRSDGRVVLVVGDVVGHDVRAARTMGQLRHAVRAYSTENPAPDSVMSRVDRLMTAVAPEEFASMFYLLLDPPTGRAVYTNAGHPPPLLVKPDGATCYLPDATSPPVGYLSPADYHNDEMVLRPSTTLLLYTDGLIERRGTSLTSSLEQLEAMTRTADPDPSLLLTAVERWLGGSTPDDDVAMLAVRTREALSHP